MAEFDDKVICTKNKITSIANQIRTELAESDTYTLDEMPQKIHEISGGGGGAVIQRLEVTENGTYTASGGVDGYSPIEVDVEPDLEDITITQNGTYTSSQHDGYDEVVVNVTATPTIQSLTVTENGTYTAPSGVDGYSPITVSVSGSGTQTTNIVLVKSLPSSLVEGAVYLIPDGVVVTPPIPIVVGSPYDIVCCNVYNNSTMVDVNSMVNYATKFWLFKSQTLGHCQSSQIDKFTWGSGNNQVMPSIIYEYDKTGSFEWVDVTSDITQSEWEISSADAYAQGKILHDKRSAIFTNYDVTRNVVGNNEYLAIQSLINSSGKVDDVYYATNFQVFFVENGIAVSQGSHDLKWVADNYN